MSEVRIRDEIARCLKEEAIWFHPDLADENDWTDAADKLLNLPAIKEALAFHESCQKAFEVNGEFVVTRENVTGKGGVSAR